MRRWLGYGTKVASRDDWQDQNHDINQSCGGRYTSPTTGVVFCTCLDFSTASAEPEYALPERRSLEKSVSLPVRDARPCLLPSRRLSDQTKCCPSIQRIARNSQATLHSFINNLPPSSTMSICYIHSSSSLPGLHAPVYIAFHFLTTWVPSTPQGEAHEKSLARYTVLAGRKPAPK